jgi:pseudouridine synthase, rluA family
MKFQIKEVRQVLAKFGVLSPDSKIDQLTHSSPSEFSVLYQFVHDKKTWAILFNTTLDDDTEEIAKLAPWPANELKIFENPDLPGSFGLPFHQKTCYLLARNFEQTRLDLYLVSQHPELSRAKLQKLIKNGQVSVNHQTVTSPKKLIDPNLDDVTIDTTVTTIKQPQQFDVLFENADLMVINKPAGVLSHATHQSSDDEFTVADFIRQHGDFTTDNYRDGIVHRLDRTTSGVMILAKNQATADFLKQQFKDRQVHKTYYAIVTGHPKHHQAKIDLPLKRSLKNAGKFMVDASGKPAVTTYQIIKSINHQHLIKLQPQTGRTHQLRVHMSYLNMPILGDYLYGGERYSRVMLHAETIEFQTPDGQHLTITAPLPSEFAPWQN